MYVEKVYGVEIWTLRRTFKVEYNENEKKLLVTKIA